MGGEGTGGRLTRDTSSSWGDPIGLSFEGSLMGELSPKVGLLFFLPLRQRFSLSTVTQAERKNPEAAYSSHFYLPPEKRAHGTEDRTLYRHILEAR